MSEMIDRVASAMQERDIGDGTPIDPAYRELARSAIAAMREPTDEMVTEGQRILSLNVSYIGVWPAMIDKALE